MGKNYFKLHFDHFKLMDILKNGLLGRLNKLMLKVLLIGSSGLIGTALGRFLGRFGQYKIILAQRTKPKLIYDYNQWFQINDAQYLDKKYLKKCLKRLNLMQ